MISVEEKPAKPNFNDSRIVVARFVKDKSLSGSTILCQWLAGKTDLSFSDSEKRIRQSIYLTPEITHRYQMLYKALSDFQAL